MFRSNSSVARAWVVLMVLTAGIAGLALSPASPATAADETAQHGVIERMDALAEDDLGDLLDFVVGNVLFTLYHEAGHMLVSELNLPVLGQEENAVDSLATIAMLESGDEEMDYLLSQAMLGWFLSASDRFEDLIFYGEHDLDQQRGYRVLCLMVGSDPDAFADLAKELDLPKERQDDCTYEYDQAVDAWDGVTQNHLNADGASRKRMISVSHRPPPPAFAAFATLLQETELMEFVAEDMDGFYRLPAPVAFLSDSCGEANAFWNPNAREMTLCYELLAAFAEIYLDVLADQN